MDPVAGQSSGTEYGVEEGGRVTVGSGGGEAGMVGEAPRTWGHMSDACGGIDWAREGGERVGGAQ